MRPCPRVGTVREASFRALQKEKVGNLKLHSKGQEHTHTHRCEHVSPLQLSFVFMNTCHLCEAYNIVTFLYTAWCSLGKSQTVKTDKPHQVKKGDCNSCTSTDLLSCSWLRMSSSLSSCNTSDLQANSVEEGGDGGKGGQETDGEKRQQTYTIHNHFSHSPHFPSPP